MAPAQRGAAGDRALGWALRVPGERPRRWLCRALGGRAPGSGRPKPEAAAAPLHIGFALEPDRMQDTIIRALRRNAADEAVALARDWIAGAGETPRSLLAGAARRSSKASTTRRWRCCAGPSPWRREDADLHRNRPGCCTALRETGAAEVARTAPPRSTPTSSTLMSCRRTWPSAVAISTKPSASAGSPRGSRPTTPDPHPSKASLPCGAATPTARAGPVQPGRAQLPDNPQVRLRPRRYVQKRPLRLAERAFSRVIALQPPGTRYAH